MNQNEAQALEALLARATELEAKVAAELQVSPEPVLPGPTYAELEAKIADLEELVETLVDARADGGVVTDEPPLVVDEFDPSTFAEQLEVEAAELDDDPEGKSLGLGCPCGETQVDEFKDGSVRCAGCGDEVKAADVAAGSEGFDFDDLDVALEPAVKAADEEPLEQKADDPVVLDEFELLLARRSQLDA